MENPTETKQQAESTSGQPPIVTYEGQSVSLNTSQLVSVCAVGLIICFFLPWISFFFFGKPSGFDLAKEGAKAEGNAVALAKEPVGNITEGGRKRAVPIGTYFSLAQDRVKIGQLCDMENSAF